MYGMLDLSKDDAGGDCSEAAALGIEYTVVV